MQYLLGILHYFIFWSSVFLHFRSSGQKNSVLWIQSNVPDSFIEKLIENCTSSSAPSPCIEISLLALSWLLYFNRTFSVETAVTVCPKYTITIISQNSLGGCQLNLASFLNLYWVTLLFVKLARDSSALPLSLKGTPPPLSHIFRSVLTC